MGVRSLANGGAAGGRSGVSDTDRPTPSRGEGGEVSSVKKRCPARFSLPCFVLGCGDRGGPRRVAWRQRQEAAGRNGVDEANKWTGAVNRLPVGTFLSGYCIRRIMERFLYRCYPWWFY